MGPAKRHFSHNASLSCSGPPGSSYNSLVPEARGKSEQAHRVYPGRPEHPGVSYNALCGRHRKIPVSFQNIDTAYENKACAATIDERSKMKRIQ